MSKAKATWYRYVKECMKMYPDELLAKGTFQAHIAEHGIAMAIKETEAKHKKDADERLSFISLVYFKKTHSFIEAALECNVSERTAQRWLKDFVYAAGRYMEFIR